jgi:hypothetical protein
MNGTKAIPSVMSSGIERKMEALYACCHRGLWDDGGFVSDDRFLRLVNDRLFNELLGRGWHREYVSYLPFWFDGFIEKETHYALEDSGFRWRAGRFEGQSGLLDAQGYKEMRNIVSYAFVKRAVDFFTDVVESESLLCPLSPLVGKISKDKLDHLRVSLWLRGLEEGDIELSQAHAS